MSIETLKNEYKIKKDLSTLNYHRNTGKFNTFDYYSKVLK